jgi:tRNA(Ile)-lysidine synthase
MKDPLLQVTKDFLSRHWRAGRPLLLGYSGGPDSKALLYLLLECQRFFPLELHVAHIDHQWREESGEEAKILQFEIEKLGLSFHLHQLESVPIANWEEEGRRARLEYFQKIFQEIKGQALILGHQADDHAETVLKRVFEGAHLRHLSGMAEVIDYRNLSFERIEPNTQVSKMPIWRPLLPVSKKDLLQWLEKKELVALSDPTNGDGRFLRGRMRTELLPLLEEKFGKGVASNLCWLSRRAEELSSYFSRKLADYFFSIKKTSGGIHWDLSSGGLEKIEWEYLVKEWLDQQRLTVSREMLEEISVCLMEKKPKREFSLKKGVLLIDRGHLFWNLK